MKNEKTVFSCDIQATVIRAHNGLRPLQYPELLALGKVIARLLEGVV
jgi:hypothetical protein